MTERTPRDWLRALREEQEKTQEQVAAEAGIALFTYQRAERGDPLSRLTARKIGRALGVSTETVLGKEVART